MDIVDRIGSEFAVYTTDKGQTSPNITRLSATDFVVTWTVLFDGWNEHSDVKAQIVSIASGTPTKVGGEFTVNTERTYNQGEPTVTALSENELRDHMDNN